MTVQNYLDCGCAIMVGGARSWCPTCSEGIVAASVPVVKKDQATILDEAFRLVNQAMNALYVELEKAYPTDSRVICFYKRDQKRPSHGTVVGVTVDGHVAVRIAPYNIVRHIHYKQVQIAPKDLL